MDFLRPLLRCVACIVISFPSVKDIRFLMKSIENTTIYTGPGKKMVPRLREFCSCCCLSLLPDIAWKILATWDPFFCRALYANLLKTLKLNQRSFNTAHLMTTRLSPMRFFRTKHFKMPLQYGVQYGSFESQSPIPPRLNSAISHLGTIFTCGALAIRRSSSCPFHLLSKLANKFLKAQITKIYVPKWS